MGQCGSCSSCARNNEVRDISEDIHSDISDDDYLERVTHITADIHEMIRRKGKVKTYIINELSHNLS